jgi:hypothetical protein
MLIILLVVGTFIKWQPNYIGLIKLARHSFRNQLHDEMGGKQGLEDKHDCNHCQNLQIHTHEICLPLYPH